MFEVKEFFDRVGFLVLLLLLLWPVSSSFIWLRFQYVTLSFCFGWFSFNIWLLHHFTSVRKDGEKKDVRVNMKIAKVKMWIFGRHKAISEVFNYSWRNRISSITHTSIANSNVTDIWNDFWSECRTIRCTYADELCSVLSEQMRLCMCEFNRYLSIIITCPLSMFDHVINKDNDEQRSNNLMTRYYYEISSILNEYKLDWMLFALLQCKLLGSRRTHSKEFARCVH